MPPGFPLVIGMCVGSQPVSDWRHRLNGCVLYTLSLVDVPRIAQNVVQDWRIRRDCRL
jgi:hypothetical protein